MQSPPVEPMTPAASPLPDVPEDDWLRALYEEAWRQYAHEGNIVYTRSSVFLAVHAGLLAVLAGVAAPLLTLQAPRQAGNAVTPVGEIVFGALLTFASLLSSFLAFVWRGVVTASQRYFTLRWAIAYAIEATVRNLRNYGIAHVEDRWRAHESKTPFVPFSALSSLQIEPLPAVRGFRSLELVILGLLITSFILLAAGLALLVHGYSRYA